MGLFTLEPIDTTPGLMEPFAPPADWEGGRDKYLALLRQRYRQFEYRQAFQVAALMVGKKEPRIAGPYAQEARQAIMQLAERLS